MQTILDSVCTENVNKNAITFVFLKYVRLVGLHTLSCGSGDMLSVAIVGECELSANTRLESLSYATQLRHLANVQHRHLLFAA